MLTTIMKWVSIAALLMVVLFWRSGTNYQLLLASVICVGAIVVVQQAIRAEKLFWAAAFVAIAVLFNPMVLVLRPSGIFPLLMVLVCIATFAISLATLKTQPRLSIPSITDRNPGSQSL